MVATVSAALLGGSLITPAAAQAADPSTTSSTTSSTSSTVSDLISGLVSGQLGAFTGTVSGVVDSMASSFWGDSKADKTAKDDEGKNDPSKDAGSLLTIGTAIGARAAWATKDATGKAVTGQGVTVALLDTGVNKSVDGLDAPGKVVNGPDLSVEANSENLYGKDGFGHGTHLAGIIAGRDDDVVSDANGVLKAAKDDQLGIAPGARILAVKAGASDGSTDVSEVIAGIDWIVQHRNDNGMRVRVINLAFGTDSTQSYLTDPLAAAVENAWRKGVVVVVSGGNDGSTATRLNNPAVDPYVIAVGASDGQGTVKGWSNPKPATFSSRGTASRHVDLVAPGRSIVSLRAPDSFVDQQNPQGRVSGDTSGRLFRGSGTSQSAAVVSGAVALLLQAYPNLTPDQVKAALVNSASPLLLSNPLDVGAGELNVSAALSQAKVITALAKLGLAGYTTQKYLPATGLGSLEAARGTSHLTDPDTGSLLTGEVDVQGQAWVPTTWAPQSAAGQAWDGDTWNGARWTSGDWSGARWTDASWDGFRWSGVRWSGTRWSGVRWSDDNWDGVRWSGARWSGARWSGARWSDSGWL